VSRKKTAHQRLVALLDTVYANVGIHPPKVQLVTVDRIPAKYRSLLVHERGMTATLERHAGGPLALRVLSASRNRHWYVRHVLLVSATVGQPVAWGAIRVDLSTLTKRLGAQLLRCQVPLGRLLRDAGVDFRSRPEAFFSATPNSELLGVFWMRKSDVLYGRLTEVTWHDTRLGEVIEILPRDDRMGRISIDA
jgi:chorismate-pyruvate lyase